MTNGDKGLKYDEGKLRLDLIPPEIIEGLGEIFTLGAARYGERNWEKGFEPGQLHAAANRHELAMIKGEFIDPDSGLPHGFHAAWNLLIMTTLEIRERQREITMDIEDIVKKYLVEHEYSGLYNEECGCSLDDLFPCGSCPRDCEPGYVNNCHSCADQEKCMEESDFLVLSKTCWKPKL